MSWTLLSLFLKDDEFFSAFLLLTNRIISDSIWPSAFKASTTVVIPKLHKEDYMIPKNFCPIVLLECPGKLISKMITSRLQSDVIILSLCHPLQFGGLKHRSTGDAGFFLTEYITKARNAG